MRPSPLSTLLVLALASPLGAQEAQPHEHGGAERAPSAAPAHREGAPEAPGRRRPEDPPVGSEQWEKLYHDRFHETFNTIHDGTDDFDIALEAFRDPRTSPQERRIAQDVLEFGTRYVRMQEIKDPALRERMLARLAGRFEEEMMRDWNAAGGTDGHAHHMTRYRDIVEKLCSGACATSHAGHLASGREAGAPTLNWAADVFLKGGDPRRAAQLASQAVEKDPASAEALRTRAGARYKLGDYQGATEDARSALRLDPKDASALAILKLTEGRGGASSAVGAPARGPTAPAAPSIVASSSSGGTAQSPGRSRLESAAQAYAIGDFPLAIREADAALGLDPKDVRALTTRAMARHRLGDYPAALGDAQAALALSPAYREALKARLYALGGLRQHALAREAAMDYLRLYPGDADVHFRLAAAEWGLGHRAESLVALRQAAELNPSRYGRKFSEAQAAGDGADLSFLFEEENAPAPAPRAPARRSPSRGAGLVGLAGLLLLALGAWLGLSARRDPTVPSLSGKTRITPLLEPTPPSLNGEPDLVGGIYKVRRTIGAGGMGTVYEAFDQRLQRTVALKRMRDEIRHDKREMERFLKEARLVASLRHPHIVEILGLVEQGSEFYMVFEYVDGKTLSDILAERWRLPWAEAGRLLAPVCQALDYAHRRDVIHRDLKPSNIMLDREGTVKVMDFGVARQAKDALSRLQMTNTVVGTPPYMAPEAEQGMVRRESDVYSLGVCLYELLTGQLPFLGTGAGMLLNKMNLSFTPASQAAPGLPAALDALISRALQPDPDKRIRTPGEFLEAMRASHRS